MDSSSPLRGVNIIMIETSHLVDPNGDTVDGRNPQPVDVVDIPVFIGFLDILGGAGFLPSTVLFQQNKYPAHQLTCATI